ncbi:hypothetical protein FQN57_005323 [Myotisia sp. PD_48]|nr:hypothetical protein FQN57_005323 [Myotisia sp. PD_48]
MSAPTGVRGLLAKFENNNASNTTTSPPPRGRSQMGSDPSSPRPLSKVRASFVAVERARSPLSRGDIPSMPSSPREFGGREFGGPLVNRNLSRSPSGKSSPVHWGITSSPHQNTLDRMVASRSTPSDPHPTRTSQPAETGLKDGLGSILKGSPFEDPVIAAPSEKAVLEPKKQLQPTTRRRNEDIKDSEPKPSSIKQQPADTSKATTISRPSNIIISKNNSRPAKSPTDPKTPKTPVTPNIQKRGIVTPANNSTPSTEPRKVEAKAASKKPSRAILNPANKPDTKHQKPELKKSNPVTKPPAPRSPTRPVRLTASLSAQTAASAARTNNTLAPRPSSRTGAGNNNNAKLNRKPSSLRSERPTVAKPPASMTAASATTVRKQPSRASLSSSQPDRPTSRTSNLNLRPGESASLARLMRPTASSENKRHEKLDIRSPPRAAPGTKNPNKTVPQSSGGSPSRLKTARPSLTNGNAPSHAEDQEVVTPADPVVADIIPEQRAEPIIEEVEPPVPIPPSVEEPLKTNT